MQKDISMQIFMVLFLCLHLLKKPLAEGRILNGKLNKRSKASGISAEKQPDAKLHPAALRDDPICISSPHEYGAIDSHEQELSAGFKAVYSANTDQEVKCTDEADCLDQEVLSMKPDISDHFRKGVCGA